LLKHHLGSSDPEDPNRSWMICNNNPYPVTGYKEYSTEGTFYVYVRNRGFPHEKIYD